MCMCSHAVLIQAEVRDLQERLVIEKEAWEGNYMKKQVCVFVRNGCSFLFGPVYICAHVCACVRACVRACMHAYMRVCPTCVSALQEATLLAKERELREKLRLERDKVSQSGLGSNAKHALPLLPQLQAVSSMYSHSFKC